MCQSERGEEEEGGGILQCSRHRERFAPMTATNPGAEHEAGVSHLR